VPVVRHRGTLPVSDRRRSGRLAVPVAREVAGGGPDPDEQLCSVAISLASRPVNISAPRRDGAYTSATSRVPRGEISTMCDGVRRVPAPLGQPAVSRSLSIETARSDPPQVLERACCPVAPSSASNQHVRVSVLEAVRAQRLLDARAGDLAREANSNPGRSFITRTNYQDVYDRPISIVNTFNYRSLSMANRLDHLDGHVPRLRHRRSAARLGGAGLAAAKLTRSPQLVEASPASACR